MALISTSFNVCSDLCRRTKETSSSWLVSFSGGFYCETTGSVWWSAALCVWQRTRCSWNASSVVPPSILWLLWHICIIYAHIHARSEANWTLRSQQSWQEMRWIVLGQACVSWPIRAACMFRRRSLKDTELQHWTIKETWFLTWKWAEYVSFKVFKSQTLQ